MNHPINWKLISDAISFYQDAGFEYKEVPWLVSDLATRITLPPNKNPLNTSDGMLVGSAEQSFIQMILDGNLNPGRYVAASPCFRDDSIDNIHQRTFFKVELIHFLPEIATREENFSYKELYFTLMIRQVSDFFHSIKGAERAYIKDTDVGSDIELNGLELGSYGFGRFKNFEWIYGTGLAEPRLSMILNLQKGEL